MNLTADRRTMMATILLLMSLLSCSQQGQEKGTVLAKINDFTLTLEEYEYQLSQELELDRDFKVTAEAKTEFLEEMIRKALLIQEAKRLKLDTKEQFIRTIQRYWESTLIRDLLDLKSKEIADQIYVTEEEIIARYSDMTRTKQVLVPLKDIRETIIEEIKEEKKTDMLEAWLGDMRQRAKVQIEKGLL